MRNIHFLIIPLLLLISSYFIYQDIQQTKKEALSKVSKKLELTRDIRIAQLNNDVKTMYSEIRFWAENDTLRHDLERIFTAWYELSFAPKVRARQLYIEDNPYYPNYTADYYNAKDGSSYSEIHEKLHELLKGLTRERGYYDVFLISINGDVIYSVFKEDEYATNLLLGKYKETSLAHGFREVMDNTNLNHVSLFDFTPYPPSNNKPASFIQTSVVNDDNKTIGVLAFQLPLEPINKILNARSGLADGIEVLAIDEDHLARNSIDTITINNKFESTAINKALMGEEGVSQSKDYRGVQSVIAYAPFQFSQNILGGTATNTWAIIVKQDVESILKPANQALKIKYMWLAGLAFISLLLTWLITNRKEDLSITEEERLQKNND